MFVFKGEKIEELALDTLLHRFRVRRWYCMNSCIVYPWDQGSKGKNFKPCRISVGNLPEHMEVEKVRRVRIRRGFRMASSIVDVGKVRRVRILRIHNLWQRIMSRLKNGCIPRVKVPRVRILHLATGFEGLEFSEKVHRVIVPKVIAGDYSDNHK